MISGAENSDGELEAHNIHRYFLLALTCVVTQEKNTGIAVV